jgi:hypothetical protein
LPRGLEQTVATPLHDLDALTSIATGGPGPARDWACTLVALRTPDVLPTLPVDLFFAEALAVRGGPAFEARLLEALRTEGEERHCQLALLAAENGSVRDLEALEAALPPDAHSPWAAWVRTRIDRATPRTLAAIANHPDFGAYEHLLPAIALQLAPAADLDATALAIATELAPRVDAEPELLAWVLSELFVFHVADDPRDDLLACAAAGAAKAGGAPPQVPVSRGGRRRRAQKWITACLRPVPGPAAALLRALNAAGCRPAAECVGTAAWLRTFRRAAPLDDVLHGRGLHAPTIAAARAGVTDLDRPAVIEAARGIDVPGSVALLLGLLDGPDPEAAASALVRWHLAMAHSPTAAPILRAAAPHVAHLVPTMLADRADRDLGLAIAPFAPTEETLGALLHLPVPASAEGRAGFAMALAAMGDRAVLPALRELRQLERDPTLLKGAIALAESILQTPV